MTGEGMLVNKFAPILVLGYRRPSHLSNVLKSLASNPEARDSILYIAIDGPRTDEELVLVEECRDIALNIDGFKEVVAIFADTNMGLANSVISNVSRVLSEHSAIIVVEDDLIVSDQFLAFMNLGLEKYVGNLKVASIHGYQYPLRISGNTCVFLRGADCWGWATWKNRWDSVNFSANSLLKQLLEKNLKNRFNLFGAVPNFRMLQEQSSSRIDSWAIRWHASMFLQNRFTLFPPRSLVLNCGLDGSGTHEGLSNQFSNDLVSKVEWEYPSETKESREFRYRLLLFYLEARLIRYLARFRSWPRKFLKLIIGRM